MDLTLAVHVRTLRARGLRGPARLPWHLWRMCFALFIAAMSFFLGQADQVPKPVRIPALLAIPVLVVPVTMLHWLWRLRPRRAPRVPSGAPEAS